MDARVQGADLRRRYRVRGVVQGVGFRWFATAAARKLGLVGWVRNEDDGSVLCEAQGPAGTLDQFAEELREGPRFAHVTDLEVTDLPPAVPGEEEFEIVR